MTNSFVIIILSLCPVESLNEIDGIKQKNFDLLTEEKVSQDPL